MSDYLPGELLSVILARLLAEDLVRCTAVSKKWYALIKSPSFISLHLQRSMEDQQRNHPLLRYYFEKPRTEHYSLRTENTFDEHKKFNFPFSAHKRFQVVGTCNGLVCITDDLWCQRHPTFIWNPVIRKAVDVPIPNFRVKSHGPFMHSFGFGFDSVANDYKIVRIVCLSRKITSPEVEIYTLNTGCWRTISDKAPLYEFKELSQQAYVHGASHWLARTTDAHTTNKRRNLILLFDMKDEIFREMPVPESILCAYGISMYLLEYQESISLVHHSLFGSAHPFCTMWVMKDYGVPESWAKLFTVDLGEVIHGRLVGMRPNDEVLFSNWDDSLLSYDYKENKVSDLAITKANCGIRHNFFVGAYTDRLVLLDKGAESYDLVINERCDLRRKEAVEAGEELEEDSDEDSEEDSEEEDWSEEEDSEDGSEG